MPVSLLFENSMIENNRKKWRHRFPHYKSIAMETRVLIQYAPKPYAAFPPSQ